MRLVRRSRGARDVSEGSHARRAHGWGGCDGRGGGAGAERVGSRRTVHPLAVQTCAAPFPSDLWTVPDAASPTGRRTVVPDDLLRPELLAQLPARDGMVPSAIFDRRVGIRRRRGGGVRARRSAPRAPGRRRRQRGGPRSRHRRPAPDRGAARPRGRGESVLGAPGLPAHAVAVRPPRARRRLGAGRRRAGRRPDRHRHDTGHPGGAVRGRGRRRPPPGRTRPRADPHGHRVHRPGPPRSSTRCSGSSTTPPPARTPCATSG